MIVKNEEAYLADSLKSAKPFVDEIIVVDTGSTDSTVEIAQAFGARVVHFPWCGDFAAARNESLRHVTGDWVLVMDADERLTQGSGEMIEKLTRVPADVVGYIVKLLWPKEGDGGMVRLGWLTRLFRNRIGAEYRGIIHEEVASSLVGKGKLVVSSITLDHKGFVKSPEEMRAKAKRNLSLLERQVREYPHDGMAWFHLAETYNAVGRLDEAVVSYRESIHFLAREQETFPDPFVAVAYQNLGVALIAQGKTDEGIVAIQHALELLPDLATAHLQLGLAYYRKIELELAVSHLAQAIELAELPCSPSRPFQFTPWLAWFYLGSAQAELEQFDAALESFRTTVRLNPDFKDAHWLLGLTALKLGLASVAIEALEAVRQLGENDVRLDINLGSARGALGDLEGAVREFRSALAKDPGSAEARFDLCRAYRGLTRWRELLKEGTTLLEVGTESPELYRLLGEACMALDAWPEATLMFESLLAMSDDPHAAEQLARCRSVLSEAHHG
jgi:tetratricopeptide (TPR) repeat protein